MKKILAFISLLFFMVACSSTEKVVSSSSSSSRGSSVSRNQSTVRNMGKFQVDSSSYVAIGKNERIQFIVVHYTAIDNAASIKE